MHPNSLEKIISQPDRGTRFPDGSVTGSMQLGYVGYIAPPVIINKLTIINQLTRIAQLSLSIFISLSKFYWNYDVSFIKEKSRQNWCRGIPMLLFGKKYALIIQRFTAERLFWILQYLTAEA